MAQAFQPCAVVFASVVLLTAGLDSFITTEPLHPKRKVYRPGDKNEFRAMSRKLEGVPLTCGMPLEEDTSLDNSAAGKMIGDRLFEQLQEIPDAVGNSCGPMCEDIAADQTKNGGPFAAFFPVNDCIRACERKAPQSVNASLQHCAPKINKSHHCHEIRRGSYCLVVKSKRSGEECLVLDANTKKAKEFRCLGGFYCVGGPASPVVCPKGFSCREGSPKMYRCRNGEFCFQTGYPWKCDSRSSVHANPADGGPPANMLRLLEGTICKRDEEGKVIIPEPCPAGHYCFAGRAKKCPSGHVCPLGSSAPTKCTWLELCFEGSAVPWRAPRAIVEFALNMGITVAAILIPTGYCGKCCSYHNVAAGIFLIAAMWMAEFYRSAYSWYSHCTLITGCFGFLLYGGFIGPKLLSRLPFVKLLGPRTRLAVDWIMLMCCLVGSWLIFGVLDLHTTLLFALLPPCLLICDSFNAGMSTEPRKQAFVTTLVSAALFALLYILDPYSHHESTAILFVLMVIPDTVKYLLEWAHMTNDDVAKINQIHEEYLVFHEQHIGKFRDRLDTIDEGSRAEVASRPEMDGAVELGGIKSMESSPNKESKDSEGSSRLGFRKSLKSQFMNDEVVEDDSTTRGIGITLENMSLFLPNGTAILRDISLTIPAISTMAVMGPSGSGKSSVMNVLSGRAGYGMVTGKIIVNNDPDGISLEELKNLTGFVPQDDVMHRKLSVLENIYFQAKLRLPVVARNKTNDWAKEMAAEVVSMMGLSHVSDSLIGDENERGISGGQRKRVSIGMELIAKPSLLFLDEPTSGLDSTTSLEVIRIMAQESKKCNCTSVAVIHQPRWETLQLFDHVALLAAGGYLAYAGPTSGVMDYFIAELAVPFPDKANPADVFMDAISLECATELVNKGDMAAPREALADMHTFGKHLANTWLMRHAEYSNDPKTAKCAEPDLSLLTGSSWGECVIAHLERSAIQMKRTMRTQMTLNALLALGVIIVVTAIPPDKVDNIIAQPIFALFFLMLVQGVAAQRVYGGPERFVAWREAGVGMNMLIYFFGKDLAALAEIYFSSGIFALVYWPLCPLQASYHTVFWTTFAFIYAVYGMSYIWSIAAEPATAQMLSVISSFVCFLLAGLQPTFVDLVSMADGFLIPTMAMSPIRYAFGYLMMDHACGPGRTSEFKNPFIRLASRGSLAEKGMPLDWVFDNDWSCVGDRAYDYGMEVQWAGCREGSVHAECLDGVDRPPNGLMCTVSHMYLIGVLFRFCALICLLVLSKKHGKGGHTVHGFARLSRALFYGFVMVFVRLQVANILLFRASPSGMSTWMVKTFKPWALDH